jgi:histidinol dehydrogenase
MKMAILILLYSIQLILSDKNIYKAGGIQAIGAMTFGTETIEKADKIFGPETNM